MIRQYNGRPRFDDGFDPKYNQDILNQAVQMYDQLRSVQNYKPIAGLDYIDYLGNALGGPDFSNIDLSSLTRPEAGRRYSGTSSSQSTKITTTGAEDMKTAQKQYDAAATAARKKQATENKRAIQTLKDNGVIGAKPASRPKYHSYANQDRGRYKLQNSNAARRESSTFSWPRLNIPGQSSDNGAKQYWEKRKAQIAAQKKRKGQDPRDIFTKIKDWAKRSGIGRKHNYGPVVTTSGVGPYR